ncbi:hypothetical protein CMUST_14335 [Corynebacterium mustelae]|uniref:Alkaline shock response membrane anchor protein AmaP n=1 Tax=Corynebacterium mustelae TaxID=571915 RepID=A0A0G3H354_9CORY|nr:hypothetical protein [Corynebacterium mustelae]AKK07160.1 hypothetical protein CMUST_14335 [Corynebacterium mustelae]
MRSISGIKNRVVLAIIGLLITLAAAWLAATLLNLGVSWPQLQPLLPNPHTHIGALLSANSNWLFPAAIAIALIALIVGIVMLISQIPRKARTAPLRLVDTDGTLMATVSPDVLARALSERAEEVPGVSGCSVWVAGSSRNIWLQASAKISQEAQVSWAVAALRRRLADDITASLGTAPQQVDVIIKPSSGTASEAVAGVADHRRKALA